MCKSNKEIFIEKSKEIHGDKYEYSKFEYVGSKIKSAIICNTCGYEFESTPSNLLLGHGCKQCSINRKKEKSDFKGRLELIYIDWKLNFDNYKNRDSIIEFICCKGHIGRESVRNMIRFNPCVDCRKEVIIKSNISKIEKNNLTVKNYITDFEIECLCNKCGYNMTDNFRNLTYDRFKCKYCDLMNFSEILKSGKSKLIEINGSNLELICSNGHRYKQHRRNLMNGKGCRLCYEDNRKWTIDEVIEEFSKIHYYQKFKYDFSKLDLENIKLRNKVEITCDNNHTFNQSISNHLMGKGCSKCIKSKGEKIIEYFLKKLNIQYSDQHTFDDCMYRNKLKFDFYLPLYNICIEYDGEFHQRAHFKSKDESKDLEYTKIRDSIKNEYCKSKGILMFRISYTDDILIKVYDVIKHLEKYHSLRLNNLDLDRLLPEI